MIISGTGHRPNKLGGYGIDILSKLTEFTQLKLRKFAPSSVVSGMALGFDTALAIAAIRENIPLIAAVPFLGQETVWPDKSKAMYNKILGKATEVIVVSPGGFSNAKMQARNEWMADRADTVLALWDGTAGGTGNCIKYLLSHGGTYINLWDEWITYPK